MTHLLTAKDTARGNQLIEHCEALIKARGAFSATVGVFKSDEFCVRYTRRDGRDSLKIAYLDTAVMEVQWIQAGDPGKGYLAEGPWMGDFLSLATAHA